MNAWSWQYWVASMKCFSSSHWWCPCFRCSSWTASLLALRNGSEPADGGFIFQLCAEYPTPWAWFSSHVKWSYCPHVLQGWSLPEVSVSMVPRPRNPGSYQGVGEPRAKFMPGLSKCNSAEVPEPNTRSEPAVTEAAPESAGLYIVTVTWGEKRELPPGVLQKGFCTWNSLDPDPPRSGDTAKAISFSRLLGSWAY